MRGGEEQPSDAARKRVAVEMIAKHERTLRRTARRYSICTEDAEDAFQRALEILLTKAPPGEARELVRWMQTVTKHEALAVRRNRERHIGSRPPAMWEDESADWIDLMPAQGAGPAERAERSEAIARSREALKTLKPAELKALTLLAEGYSYTEIGEMTGYSQTKVNRCLAEGRERFRAFLTRSESGDRCAELQPLLSAFCDGEAGPEQVATLREHLRVCAHCRAAMRAYRAAPRAVAVLAPAPFALRGLLDRAHEAFAGLQARLPGQGGGVTEASVMQMSASGGAGGAGVAGMAKVLAVCAGTAGGAAACVAAGVVPAPLGLAAERAVAPKVQRVLATPDAGASGVVESPPEPAEAGPPADPRPEQVEPTPVAVETGAVEYRPEAPEAAPPPEPAPPPVSSAAEAPPPAPAAPSGNPAGEFGP